MTNSELMYAHLVETGMKYGLKIVAAIAILVVGFWLSNRLADFADHAFNKRDFDMTIRVYLARVLGIALKVLVVITAAGVLGVETTSFVAVLGAAGLAVGLALQGSLSNFAGGVMILILRPFEVGDSIISQGQGGVVTAIDVFYITILSSDNRRVILPNGPLIGNVITNSTAEPIRRVEVTVGVGYDADMAKVETVLLQVAALHPKVVSAPTPQVGILSFGDSSVNITFRTWCLTNDHSVVLFDMYKLTKQALDAAHISIPFPQREVRLLKETT